MKTKIRALRIATGDSIIDFCQKHKINPSTMSRVERRKEVTSMAIQTRLAEIFGVPAWDIFDEDFLAIEE